MGFKSQQKALTFSDKGKKSYKKMKNYFSPLLIILFIVLSYSIYLFFPDPWIENLGKEDGFFEYLTALFFIMTSILFLKTFLSKKNYFFLLLAIVFFIGFGEEISWGQRILDFETPEALEKINVQREFTFHNIEIFNAHDFEHNLKSGIKKIFTINFLYRLFYLTYCILLPMAFITIHPFQSLLKKIHLPIPPLSIGIFFFLNWLLCKISLDSLLPNGNTPQYYDTIVEIQECASAFIFMILSFYFFKIRQWMKPE